MQRLSWALCLFPKAFTTFIMFLVTLLVLVSVAYASVLVKIIQKYILHRSFRSWHNDTVQVTMIPNFSERLYRPARWIKGKWDCSSTTVKKKPTCKIAQHLSQKNFSTCWIPGKSKRPSKAIEKKSSKRIQCFASPNMVRTTHRETNRNSLALPSWSDLIGRVKILPIRIFHGLGQVLMEFQI